MKFSKEMQYIGIIYLVGLLIGSLFANFVADSYVVKTDFFSEYYLLNFANNNSVKFGFVMSIITIRLIPFIAFFLLRRMKHIWVLCTGFVVWTGFSCGLLISVELMNMGGAGILFYIASVIPQIFFYVPAYLLELTFCMQHREVCSMKKMIICISCMVVGIIMECIFNIIILTKVIQLIF